MKRFLWLVVALVMLLSCAQAEDAVVTAVGSASVQAAADGAVLVFCVDAAAETLDEAESKAAASISALKKALVAAGAAEESIVCTRADVQLERQYRYNKLQEAEMVVTGRVVDYTVTVPAADLTALLNAAVGSGAYAEYTVQLSEEAMEAAGREALAQAAKNAIARASLLAGACGLRQTELAYVTEVDCRADGLTVTAVVEVALEEKE